MNIPSLILPSADTARSRKRWIFYGRLSTRAKVRCHRVRREFGSLSSSIWKKTKFTSGAGKLRTRIGKGKNFSLCLYQSTIWALSKNLKSSSTSRWSYATKTRLTLKERMVKAMISHRIWSCQVSSSFACQSRMMRISSIKLQNYSSASRMKSCLTQKKRRKTLSTKQSQLRWS